MDRCYRHPQVETAINCTRCNRPICIACMVNAPVGYQCPDCVAGAPRVRVRQVDTTSVTRRIIGLCVAVYVLGGILNVGLFNAANLGMSPIDIAGYGQWYHLLTAAFLHGGILHIAFNMYVLFALGPTLERILGHGRFLLLYLLAALGGARLVFVDGAFDAAASTLAGPAQPLSAAQLTGDEPPLPPMLQLTRTSCPSSMIGSAIESWMRWRIFSVSLSPP